MDKLSLNRTDQLVSVAKATAAAVPYFGGVISELLTETIPGLRLDRAIAFIRELDRELKTVETRVEYLEKKIWSEQDIDLLEEGILQASRAVSPERKVRLARLVARSLNSEELEYEQAKTLLNIYKELTDPEIIWLLYYSLNPILGPGPHRQWKEQHPEVLTPISREVGASQDQRERLAMQELWKENLKRFGLICYRGKTTTITTLGRMLVRKIRDEPYDGNN